MAKKEAPRTALELIEDAAANPNLTAKEAVLNLARLAMHLGLNQPDKLQKIGPALGNMALGIGKVAAAEAKQGDGDDDALLARFAAPLK